MKVTKNISPYGGGIQSPDRLIIHSMGEIITAPDKDYYADEWLEHLKYSAHFLIKPNGDIIKTRKTTTVAYHAKNNNTNTVGIEFLVPGRHNYATFLEAIKEQWVSEAQFEAGIELSKGIMSHYGMDIDDVQRHSDIDPGRKVDPGEGFDWELFKSNLSC